jgi:nucleosome binding factor SPN SPT16 subunit
VIDTSIAKMSDVELNTQSFFKRAARIFDAWDQGGAGWEDAKSAEALLILMGDSNDQVSYTKSSSLQVSR